MTPHNEAKIGEIAKIVLMPGDPLRAKWIAENFLEEAKLVNKVRGMFAYTGKYKGKEVTVMASGMGMPSMGIYSYELYQFYDVETIIRIGSCGAYAEELELLDVVLVEESYTPGNFAKNMSGKACHEVAASSQVNARIVETATALGITCHASNVVCTECFDEYMVNPREFAQNLPKEKHITCAEMESFALLYTAQVLGKKAACLLTVVDKNGSAKKQSMSAEEREKALGNMIKLSLETSLKLA